MSAPPQATAYDARASVLQKSFSLDELLDMESFRELCESYSELFQIGFKIFDDEGELLVDVKSGGTDLCAYLFTFPEGKIRCTQEVGRIREIDLDPAAVTPHDCFTGLRYLLAPIVHEGSLIGRIVYGPFLPADAARPDISALGVKVNPDIADNLVGKVRRAQNEVVQKVVGHLKQTIEVMLYIGYKHALTSRMHVEAVTASYTELQQKNRALEESYQRLKELDRLKSNFLATVSHELRTPLTSVIGYSEMLQEGLAGELTEEQGSYVGTIMEKGEQLLGLISGILDFSKIESGNLRLNLVATNPVEIARSAVSTVLPIAHKQGITVELAAPDDPPTILADGDKLRQVLVNIVGNAVKFNRQQGRVTVRVERCNRPIPGSDHDDVPAALAPPDQECIRIQVADTGVGIPPDKLERIFDSFYQVDGSSTREYGGTGLGLAIARSLVEIHRGTIEVESTQGQGSTFSVVIPTEHEA